MILKNDNLKKFLFFLFILTTIVGIGYYFLQNLGITFLNTIYLAVVYMPLPFYSLFLFSKIWNVKIKYGDFFSIKGIKVKEILLTILIFLVWVFFSFLLTYIFGLIAPDVFGSLITDNSLLLKNIVNTFGEEFAHDVDLPPSPLLLIPITIFGAITAGLTINMVFALGEEIVWRGYLWSELKLYSFYKKHMLIGALWGLWHVPIVLQGHNYGQENGVLGSIFFIFFCMAFSLIFGLLIERTRNAIYPAILHGVFNGFAGLIVILVFNYNPFLGGAVGLIAILAILKTFVFLKHLPIFRFN